MNTFRIGEHVTIAPGHDLAGHPAVVTHTIQSAGYVVRIEDLDLSQAALRHFRGEQLRTTANRQP